MLIIEGPDGAGKTSLVNLFREKGIPQAPRAVGSDTKPLTDLCDWVDHSLDQGFQFQVYDRHSLISAPIYGPILKGMSPQHFGELSWIGPRLGRLYEINPIIIYCLPPYEEVFNNIKDDPDNKVIANKIAAIYDAYAARIALDDAYAPCTVKVWDYTKSLTIDDKPAWFNGVVQTMKRRNHA